MAEEQPVVEVEQQQEQEQEQEPTKDEFLDKPQEDDNGNDKEKKPEKLPETCYARLRGLPFSCTEKEIHAFFGDLKINKVSFASGHDGRPSGEAYVEFSSIEDVVAALEFNRKEMKNRYIEVFEVNKGEMSFVRNRGLVGDEGRVVRLRGLPWSCNEGELKKFFEGIEIEEVVFGNTGGPRPRPSGEAYVLLASAEGAQRAMEYNNKNLGSRYVEVFHSTLSELNREKGIFPEDNSSRSGIRPLMSIQPRRDMGGYGGGRRGGGYDDSYGGRGDSGYGRGYDSPPRGGGGYGGPAQYRVYMRGLPFDADAHSITRFFTPITPVVIKIGINETRRPSGDAMVEFSCAQDAHASMSRNNQLMGKRYVELFEDPPAQMRKNSWKEVSGPSSGRRPEPLFGSGGGRGGDYGGYGGGGRGGGRDDRDGWGNGDRRGDWGGDRRDGGRDQGGYGRERDQGGYGRAGPAPSRDSGRGEWAIPPSSGGYGGGGSYQQPYGGGYEGNGYGAGGDRQRDAHAGHDSNYNAWGGWAGTKGGYN